MRHLALILLLPLMLISWTVSADTPETYRGWVESMKEAERGPFSRLRWFCNDGSVLPPKAYACSDHGGGYQHGEWSDRTRELRDQGYWIANLFAGIEPESISGESGFGDRYAQILIERYLVGADDGWILRRALFYRGAIQEEDEREGARKLLTHLAAQPEWIESRFGALRAGARLLPHGEDSASAQGVRQESAALSDRDRGFRSLRAKIHGAPDAGDADRVRDYARQVSDAGLRERYEALASQIDAVYQSQPLAATLQQAAGIFSGGPWLQDLLRDAAGVLERDPTPSNRYQVTAGLLADLRESMGRIRSADARLRVLDLSLKIEDENFRAAAELRERLGDMNRSGRLELLGAGAQAAYGVGLIKKRELDALLAGLDSLDAGSVELGFYLQRLRDFGRLPAWGTQNLRFLFFESMQKLAEIEPKAMLFIQDQLRGSPLLFYAHNLDGLSRDANRAAGVRHNVFGEEIGTGFQALNPGIAVGVLHATPDLDDMEAFDPEGIYLLPETVSDLPPIAGILTAGEGNPLSHVQLLARNLGIPNVAVNEQLVDRLAAQDGRRVVMAVSPAGLVELSLHDDAWEQRLGDTESSSDVVIRPDLDKLDLSERRLIDLDELRAEDSGRTVGPKAAKLGGLRSAFPEAVAPGIAIPFGLFKAEILDRPYRGGQGSVFDWMTAEYRRLDAMQPGSEERKAATEAFRAQLYDTIVNTKPSEQFLRQLREAMQKTFGVVDTGVFVRSDTNVEDLAGFTGAGLNLTLPNVVGFDNLVDAITQVWASPFTARAFAWRQSHMESPEHVYTSILLLRSVASDKSGVLVTQDLDTGDRAVLSVAVNEGLGGAVDGQAAESLRIDTRDGSVRLLATATAPWRRVPGSDGGIVKLPASGSDVVLQPDEIIQLIAFARDDLPARFPKITNDAGEPAAADVEFGFLDGRLRLFQIRPFLESRSARGNAYLIAMDSALGNALDRAIRLDEVPSP